MSIDRLPFERRPRNSIANNLDRMNELVDWVNQDTHLYASANGERMTADDASSVKGLTVDGRSVQDGTPTPDEPVPVQVVRGRNLCIPLAAPATQSGLTFTPQSDGSIRVTGSPTGMATVFLSTEYEIQAGATLTLSGCPTGGGMSTYRLDMYKTENAIEASDYGNSVTKTISGAVNRVRIAVYKGGGSNVDITFRPQLEAGSTVTPYVPYGSIGIIVGDTATPIDLQGNTLASLPDGTRDELHVDSAGHVTIEKRVGKYVFDGTQSVGGTTGTAAYYTISTITDMVSPPQLAPSSSSPHASGYPGWCNKYAINDNYIASNPIDNTTVISSRRFSDTNRIAFFDSVHTSDNATWITYVSAAPITLYYPYSEPQYIDLGYIDPPAIPSGSVVTVSASLTPTLHIEYWVDDGITELVNDLIAYVDYKTEG